MPKKCKGDSCCNCNVSDGSGSSSEEETDDIDSVRSELSGEINTVNTRLSNHISDTHCHTTNVEKNYWNNKLDATTFDTTIAALRSDIPLNPITSANLADALEALGLLDGNHNPSTGGGSGSGSGSYLKAGDFLGTINNISFVQGDDITIPVGSDPSTWDEQTWQNIYNYIEQHGGGSYKITGLSFADNILTIQQENNTAKTVTINAGTPGTGSFGYSASTTSSTPNSYLIGTITYNGNSYPIYGKDGGSADIDLATDRKIGGILIGYTENAADRNYPVLLDGGKAYVHVPWTTFDDIEPGHNEYDWEGLDQRITNIETIIDSVGNNLDTIYGNIEDRVESTVEGLVSDADWFVNNIEWDTVFHKHGWDDEMKEYLSTVAIVTDNGQTVTWSNIVQRVDALESAVSSSSTGGDGNIEVITSNVYNRLTGEGGALAGMSTLYSELDENKEIIRWLTSGFESYTDGTLTQAIQSAAGSNDLSNRIAAVETQVTDTTASGTLAAKVTNLETGMSNLAGVIVESNLDTAVAQIFAKGPSGSSALQTLTDANGAFMTAVVDATGDSLADLAFVAQNDNAAAKIVATVNGSSSDIYLNADKIHLEGQTIANYIQATDATIGSLSTKVATIENAYVDEATVRNIASQYATVANSLRVGTAGSSEIQIDAAEDVESPRIAIYDNNGDECTVFGGEEQERDFGTIKNYIKLDGSGFFANQNFRWNASGNITASNITTTSGTINGTLTVGSGSNVIRIIGDDSSAKIYGFIGNTQIMGLSAIDGGNAGQYAMLHLANTAGTSIYSNYTYSGVNVQGPSSNTIVAADEISVGNNSACVVRIKADGTMQFRASSNKYLEIKYTESGKPYFYCPYGWASYDEIPSSDKGSSVYAVAGGSLTAGSGIY